MNIARLTGGLYFSRRDAGAEALASAIMQIPASETAIQASSSPAAPPPAPDAEPYRFPWLQAVLWSVLGAGLIVAALALALRARSLPKRLVSMS